MIGDRFVHKCASVLGNNEDFAILKKLYRAMSQPKDRETVASFTFIVPFLVFKKLLKRLFRP